MCVSNLFIDFIRILVVKSVAESRRGPHGCGGWKNGFERTAEEEAARKAFDMKNGKAFRPGWV